MPWWETFGLQFGKVRDHCRASFSALSAVAQVRAVFSSYLAVKSLPTKRRGVKMNHADLLPVLDFLGDLKRHNNKAWFEEHRAAYDTARINFENFVDQLIGEYGRLEDLGGITAKDCIMRIYRDTRFSKDKSPYKISMGATIAPGGKKSASLGYHLHMQPHDETLIAGGLYMPTPEQLARFRAAIDRDAAPFKTIL